MPALHIAVGVLAILSMLVFAILFGFPPLPIGIITLRMMEKNMEEAEQKHIENVLEARKASEALLNGRKSPR